MKVAKWGNSLAVRIPSDVARLLGLKAGDEVHLKRGTGDELEVERRREAVRALGRYRGLIPDRSFDRDAANER